MNATEKRNTVVSKVKSREGKNQYTQSDKRTRVDAGYSDCSSLCWWAYKQIGKAIGTYTGAQIENGTWVTRGGSYPDEGKLRPGDLLFFATNYNNGRPYRVGHVEMYVGGGQISGHGSGIGPTRKNMKEYCRQRNNAGKPYIGVKRYIPDDGSENKPEVPETHETMFVGRVIATELNVRSGPGTSYGSISGWPMLAKTNLVDVLEKVGSWYLVRIANKYNGYVYAAYIEKVSHETEPETDGPLNRKPKWVGKVTATELSVRIWAGTENRKLRSWPILEKTNLVDVCDTVKAKDGSDWYYIRIAGKIYGFAHSKYIKKT